MTNLPRGLRNNNPLNIRRGERWQGLVLPGTDPQFCQFKTMLLGVRAGFVLLRQYIKKYSCNTVRSIVSRWAPPCENDTQAYITNISRWVRIDPDMTIRYEDKPRMLALMGAMIRQECGTTIPEQTIINAYNATL